jgi:arylsulfatase A-like enzyme
MDRFVLPFLVFAFAISVHGAESSRRPNLVLFLVDDMGWIDTEPYGSRYYETPNFTRFASGAMRFTNAYSVPLCSPTRATILTGQYSARHGITSATGHQAAAPDGASRYPDKAAPTSRFLYPASRNFLDPGLAALPEVLKSAGYRTGHFGKWHLGIAPEHRPDRHGFETVWFCVPDPGPPSYFSPYGVKAEGEPGGKNKIGTITDGPEGESIVDRVTDEALEFIEAHREEPFFLNLWQYGLHGPWGPKEAYTAAFAKKEDPRGKQGNPIMASMIRSVDESLGRVLDKLEELGLAENTLVIVTSDNGGNVHSNTPGDRKAPAAKGKEESSREALLADWRKWAGHRPPTNNAPLREGKGRIYEGGQRVPLMIRWPGRIAPGTVNDTVVGAVDFYPTLVEAAGLARPEGHVIDGVSLLPVLEGRGSLERDAYFTWFPHLIPAVSVRSGDWKLIRRWEPHRDYPEVRELYDLEKDPGEATNLAKAHPDKVAELDARIDRFIAETGAAVPIPNPASREPESTPGNGSVIRTPAGLVPKQCTAELAGGVLRVTATGPRPFLGTVQVKFAGPLKVTLRVRAPGGGRVACRWRTAFQDEFPAQGQVVESTLSKSAEWQETTLGVPVAEIPGTLRIHLPVTEGQSIEIGSIRIEGASGRVKEWSFGP